MPAKGLSDFEPRSWNMEEWEEWGTGKKSQAEYPGEFLWPAYTPQGVTDTKNKYT